MGETLTIDQREQRFVAAETLVSQIRAQQMEDLEVLDQMQIATADGSRSLSEWAATRLDLSLVSAKSLVRTMRRTVDRSGLRDALASGEVSFDRVEALSKIPDPVGFLSHLDVGGVYREAARRTPITAANEVKTAEANHLFLQYTLDETWARIQGGMDGYSASLVDKTLTGLADAQPDLPDGTRGDRSWRKATALVELCTSGGGEDAPPAQVTVFVDATEATVSNGEAGVMLKAGPKVGVQALQSILCDATTEVTVIGDDGIPMVYGRRTRTAPPALKRAVIRRAGGVCEADGCNSRFGWKPTMRPPGRRVVRLILMIWWRSAGSTTTSSSTNEASKSTDIPTTEESASENRTHRNHRTDLARGGASPPPRDRPASRAELEFNSKQQREKIC
jgi:hypothetical protein